MTGLIWEVKQNKDSTPNYSDPNVADNTYTWYDGSTGNPGEGTDTEDFINDLNAVKIISERFAVLVYPINDLIMIFIRKTIVDKMFLYLFSLNRIIKT